MNTNAQFTSEVFRSQRVEDVGVKGLTRLQENAQALMAKAMELTDSWGQAMFIMDQPLVEKLFAVMGFSKEVCSKVYEGVRSLAYVQHKRQGQDTQPQFTWHALDATCMTLRGITDLNTAMSGINDDNVERFLANNLDLFEKIMEAIPSYGRNLMFSPEVAERVVTSLGGNISADKLYDLAWKFGGQVTKDLEGRRGLSTQFIRSFTLTISARI